MAGLLTKTARQAAMPKTGRAITYAELLAHIPNLDNYPSLFRQEYRLIKSAESPQDIFSPSVVLGYRGGLDICVYAPTIVLGMKGRLRISDAYDSVLIRDLDGDLEAKLREDS